VDTTRSKQEQPAKRNPRPTKMYHACPDDNKQGSCVYCGEKHKPVVCNKITNLSDCRQILLNRRLCFHCISGSHRASHCPRKLTCQCCRKRHHTSLCETIDPTNEHEQPRGVALTTNQNGDGLFPVLIIEVNGIKCRALIDSGAGSSCVSSTLSLAAGDRESSTRTMEAPSLRQESGYVNCENTNVSKVFWMDTTSLGSLSHAPWWRGQFKRLIGVVKSAMYKVIGGGVLSWTELSKVLLDGETQINQPPLSYLEDDVEVPILSHYTFLFQ